MTPVTDAATRLPRRNMAELVLYLENAGIALERLERQRDQLTGPGELVGVWDLRRTYDNFLATARHVLGQFAQHDLVEGPGRGDGDLGAAPSHLSRAPGVPEQAHDHLGCPELAEGQIWINCYASDRWRVERLNPCPAEGPAVLLRALDGAHEGSTVIVRVGLVREQAILVTDQRASDRLDDELTMTGEAA